MSARVEIEHSAEGSLASFQREDVEARAAVKAAGFRWSRNLGQWFLPRNWSEPVRRGRVAQVVAQLGSEAVAVEDGGRAPVSSAAEREEAARERAADRAEHMASKAVRLEAASDAASEVSRKIGEHIPFGQPILVGHHSEGRHRRALDRIESQDRKSVALSKEAEEAAAAAERAERAAAGESPLMRLRRVERKSTELRGVQREIAQMEARGGREAAPSWWDQQVALRDRLADEIAHDQQMVEASGHKVFSKADIAKGDLVKYRGRWHRVEKVNAKSVGVPSGYSWLDKIEMHQISEVKKVSADVA